MEGLLNYTGYLNLLECLGSGLSEQIWTKLVVQKSEVSGKRGLCLGPTLEGGLSEGREWRFSGCRGIDKNFLIGP